MDDGIVIGEGVVLDARPASFATRMLGSDVDLTAQGVVLLLLLPVLLLPLPVWMPALAAAAVLIAAFAFRRPSALTPRLVPWSVLLFACGLFLAVQALHAAGLTDLLAGLLPKGDGPAGLFGLAAAGMLGANALDNLPAYLALEPLATGPLRMAALLVGVNAGALVTPWASLAILLWHDRLVAMGVRMPWGRYMLLSVVVAPVTVVLGVVALWAVHGA